MTTTTTPTTEPQTSTLTRTRPTPMFPVQCLTYWTNESTDHDNRQAERRLTAKARKTWKPRPYKLIYLVFVDRVERAPLASYTTAVEAADAAFSSWDFRGLVTYRGPDAYEVVTQGGRFKRYRQVAGTVDDAAQVCREVYEADAEEMRRCERDPLYALECELACADWYYEMSDDPGVYRGGVAHFARIDALVKLAGEAGEAMYEAARAKGRPAPEVRAPLSEGARELSQYILGSGPPLGVEGGE